MRQYEVAVVLHPDLEMDFERVSSKIEGLITGLGGKIDKKDNWGKRKLAYQIRKQDWGIYAFYQVSLDPSQVQPLDGVLRITDEVMRYLITSMAEVSRIRPKSSKPSTGAPKEADTEKADKTEANDEAEVAKDKE